MYMYIPSIYMYVYMHVYMHVYIHILRGDRASNILTSLSWDPVANTVAHFGDLPKYIQIYI